MIEYPAAEIMAAKMGGPAAEMRTSQRIKVASSAHDPDGKRAPSNYAWLSNPGKAMIKVCVADGLNHVRD
jgi:hypothetical protein